MGVGKPLLAVEVFFKFAIHPVYIKRGKFALIIVNHFFPELIPRDHIGARIAMIGVFLLGGN